MKIYTRSGDRGQTHLLGGQPVSKADLRVEAYGSVDELNAAIGLAEPFIDDPGVVERLRQIQSQLFHVGADLATPQACPERSRRSGASERTEAYVQQVPDAWVKGVEEAIDQAERELAPLRNFILPGGTPGAAALHVARTVCRRAERRVAALAEHEDINPTVLIYLNRLSDLLFVLARLVNQRAGEQEIPWRRARRSDSSDG